MGHHMRYTVYTPNQHQIPTYTDDQNFDNLKKYTVLSDSIDN